MATGISGDFWQIELGRPDIAVFHQIGRFSTWFDSLKVGGEKFYIFLSLN